MVAIRLAVDTQCAMMLHRLTEDHKGDFLWPLG